MINQEVNNRKLQRAKLLVMGEVLALIDSDRDDLTMQERVSAAAEVIDGEEGEKPSRHAVRALYH